MAEVIYSSIDVLIDEKRKEMIINPRGERFYFVECEGYKDIYTNATITREDDGALVVEGDQELYTIHDASGLSYEKLRCAHPEALIRKRSFLWIRWYSVYGILKRQVHSRYRCMQTEYRIHERLKLISQSIEERLG